MIGEKPVNPELQEQRENEHLPQRVYYVHCPQDDTVLVATDVNIQGRYVRWFDTVKERMMHFAQKKLKENGEFTFTRLENQEGADAVEYTFIPMDLRVYEQHVKNQLIKGEHFDTDADLIAAFLAVD